MSYDTEKAVVVELFSAINSEQGQILWQNLIEKSRKIYKAEPNLLKEIQYFNNMLQPFVQSIMRFYYQEQCGSEWLQRYNETGIKVYLNLIEYRTQDSLRTLILRNN